MPLDETLPTYHFQPDKAEPLRTEISFAQFSSIPEPKYAKQHIPNSPNAYSFILHDSAFQSIVFAEVRALLEPVTNDPKGRRGSAEANDHTARFQIPRDAHLNLFNPDYSTPIVHRPSTGPFSSASWEFSLPKETFYQPTGSLLDAGRPPRTEYATFRWRKEGVISPLLRCTYSPAPIPGKGKRGVDEPDITVAIFSGWESSAGKLRAKGELTVFEPNQRRLDIQDWKGLEIALVASARAVVDIWFSKDVRETFQYTEITPSASQPARIPIPAHQAIASQASSRQQTSHSNAQIQRQHMHHRQPPLHQIRQSTSPAQLSRPQPQQQPRPANQFSSQTAAALAKQEAEARKLQAIYEAEEAARQKAIEKESQRLRREYEKEKAAFERKQKKNAERSSRHQQVHIHSQASLNPPMPPRPMQHSTLAIPSAQVMKKKSFWGLKIGGSGDSSASGGFLSPSPAKNKLEKRKSSFW